MSSSDSTPAQALKELLIEVTLLHHHVAIASRALAGPSDLTNAQVSILRSLVKDRPQTVPQLASERGIARQPVQRSVDELHAAGFVDFGENPRHKRSRLVRPTPDGRRRLRKMERRQSQWTKPVADDFSVRALRSAAGLLRRIRGRLQHDA